MPVVEKPILKYDKVNWLDFKYEVILIVDVNTTIIVPEKVIVLYPPLSAYQWAQLDCRTPHVPVKVIVTNVNLHIASKDTLKSRVAPT